MLFAIDLEQCRSVGRSSPIVLSSDSEDFENVQTKDFEGHVDVADQKPFTLDNRGLPRSACDLHNYDGGIEQAELSERRQPSHRKRARSLRLDDPKSAAYVPTPLSGASLMVNYRAGNGDSFQFPTKLSGASPTTARENAVDSEDHEKYPSYHAHASAIPPKRSRRATSSLQQCQDRGRSPGSVFLGLAEESNSDEWLCRCDAASSILSRHSNREDRNRAHLETASSHDDGDGSNVCSEPMSFSSPVQSVTSCNSPEKNGHWVRDHGAPHARVWIDDTDARLSAPSVTSATIRRSQDGFTLTPPSSARFSPSPASEVWRDAVSDCHTPTLPCISPSTVCDQQGAWAGGSSHRTPDESLASDIVAACYMQKSDHMQKPRRLLRMRNNREWYAHDNKGDNTETRVEQEDVRFVHGGYSRKSCSKEGGGTLAEKRVAKKCVLKVAGFHGILCLSDHYHLYCSLNGVHFTRIELL